MKEEIRSRIKLAKKLSAREIANRLKNFKPSTIKFIRKSKKNENVDIDFGA